jgi:Ni,Fe-hydrogenase I small subunit
MAITRRQFVTRLGALAAAAGFSQVEASKIMDAVAYPASGAGMSAVYQGTFGKPRVVWLHGAECTGCSTSLLGIFENVNGTAVYNSDGTAAITTVAALQAGQTLPTTGEVPAGNASGGTLLAATGLSPDPAGSIDIADVVIDVIDLLYHETVMGMGGDTAYKWLKDFVTTNGGAKPFVLVVEGALQWTNQGGAWGDASANDTTVATPTTMGSGGVAWCSIAASGSGTAGEIRTGELVSILGDSAYCVAIVAIGQCAAFGGYPGCRPPVHDAEFDSSKAQSGAQSVEDYLVAHGSANAAAKVVNVPGCPTNPWWFVLSIVALTVDLRSILVDNNLVGTLGILKAPTTGHHPVLGENPLVGVNMGSAATCGVDTTRRIKAIYGTAVHGPYCPRFRYYTTSVFATYPGDAGCLQNIGCHGPVANSLCGLHGWNGQQPENASTTAGAAWDKSIALANTCPDGTPDGGHCTRAGHPCMACTEIGYPDNYVPFVRRH